MGRRKSRRQVVTAPRARRDLSAIFEYNEVHRGLRDATRYARFLEDQIESLEDDWYLGLSIEGHPGLRYHIMKRRPGGDGHLALYLVEEDRVLVLRVFHTKQDWQSSL